MDGIAGIFSPYPSFLEYAILSKMDTRKTKNTSPTPSNLRTECGVAFASITYQYLQYFVTLDGMIINAKTLQLELESIGYHFIETNDACIIAAAYDFWKEKSLQKLEGSFAFALYDTTSNSVLLTRDRLGEKPLFYYADFRERGRFVQLMFAYDMQTLWRIGAPRNMDAGMTLNYLTLGMTSNPNKKMATFYSDILSLPPGNYLKIYPKEGRTQMRSWYRPNFETNDNIDENEVSQTLADLLENAIAKRIVPNTVFFYDENIERIAVSHFIRKIENSSKNNNATKTLLLENNWTDSLVNIEENHLNTFFELMEEPVENANVFLDYQKALSAKKFGMHTLFDTLGANKIMGGSNAYILFFLQYQLRNSLSLFKKEKKLFQENGFLKNWTIRDYWQAFTPEQQALKSKERCVKIQNNFPFLDKNFLMRFQNEDTLRQPEIHRPEDAMFFDTFTIGLKNQLKWKSKIASHHLIKMAYPFLQNRLLEFIFTLPTSFKFRNGFDKWILRFLLEKQLSSNIVWQKKKMENGANRFIFSNEIKRQALETLVLEKLLDKKILKKKTDFNKEIEWRIVNIAHLMNNKKNLDGKP